MIFQPIILSLKVSFIATFFTFVIGVGLARIFTKLNFKGKSILEVIIILPMVLPPSVTGYLLLMFIGRRGPLGGFLYNNFNVQIVFTWVAAVIASSVVSLPLMYQNAKSAFQSINPAYENAARTLGAGSWRTFFMVALPLAWPGIVSGIVLSFARALGEFGATLMVAGNIPGKTQTIPLSIYFLVEAGDNKTADILVAIVTVFSFILIFAMNSWLKKRSYNDERVM